MAAIESFGRYLPETVITSSALAERLQVTEEWIVAASGIRERRMASAEETVASMAVQAAEHCFSHSKVSKSEVGLVLLSSGSAEQRFPGPAATVATKLGLIGIPAIDIPHASTGSLYAIALAMELVEKFGPILIVASEKMSGPAMTEPLTKEITPLFGDGAGACIVVPGEKGLSLVGHALHSDGSFAEALSLDHGQGVHMDGKTVILQAARKIPAVIAEVLSKHSVAPSEVAAYVMHQANQNLIDRVAKGIGVEPSRFPSNIARYGNTSSASLLIAASEYFEGHPAVSGERFCFAAFGAGFHWGAVLATMQ